MNYFNHLSAIASIKSQDRAPSASLAPRSHHECPHHVLPQALKLIFVKIILCIKLRNYNFRNLLIFKTHRNGTKTNKFIKI